LIVLVQISYLLWSNQRSNCTANNSQTNKKI